MKTRKRLGAFAAALCVTMASALSVGVAGAASGDAGTITNGTVTLGVNKTGSLITDDIGITYDPTGNDGIAPGCWCEGWGAGDAVTNVSGWSDSENGDANIEVESFSREADSAVSTVAIPTAADPVLRVTHDFHRSASINLFEATVTIENVSDATVEPRYRRAMDWDIPPTTFNEAVTIQGGTGSANLLFASDNGFESPNPFADRSWINFVGDAVKNTTEVLTPGGTGPSSDHGALFDFGFDPLAPGASVTFNIYYGAAGNETSAQLALGAVDAELYSFGQPSDEAGLASGSPNTFIFAFAKVGGAVAFDPLVLTPPTASVPVGGTHTVTATFTVGGEPVAGQEIDFEVTSGPTAGLTGTAVTDGDGKASFNLSSAVEGTDTIVASTDADGSELTSAPATVTWTGDTPPDTTVPDTTVPDTVPDTTVPDTVPDTTVPDTVPVTTAPRTTVPLAPVPVVAAPVALAVAAEPTYTG